MFEQSKPPEQRNLLTDWFLRGGIALLFALFGKDKFPSGPGEEWVRFFAQIGLGQGFRYFTGIVEIPGGLLVLIPWTVTLGLAILACTMAGAALIHIFVMHHPFNAFIPSAILAALMVFWRSRQGG
jgi:putative oxidoreductase